MVCAGLVLIISIYAPISAKVLVVRTSCVAM